MSAYITGTGIISPQQTFGQRTLPENPKRLATSPGTSIAPDFKSVIPPAKLRRMSRILKMGVAAGMQALSHAKISAPDAIVTATALGCTEDTERFLREMVERDEQALSPTAFIQSTHNTIGGQLALLMNLNHYNMTYTQRGHSFETALLDALMLVEEGSAANVLLGAVEELIEPVNVLMQRMGIYRTAQDAAHRGVVGGEGASFFVLSSSSKQAMARVVDVKIFHRLDHSELPDQLCDWLNKHALFAEDVDLIITGRNGNIQVDLAYDSLMTSLFRNTSEACFKPLCGEYQTSVAFAVWMAAVALKNNFLPDYVFNHSVAARDFQLVLICNHTVDGNWSFTLLSRP